MRIFTISAAVICCLLVFGNPTAYGDNTPEPRELKEVVITAQKQREDPQSIPISLTLLDAMDVEDREIGVLRDVSNYTPSLMMFDLGFSTTSPPSIRGLFADAITLESTMGVYVDGVPMTMGIGINDPILDIERIEVLKGPQGTLYGKNTEAGVLNIITTEQGNDPTRKVSVRGGSDNLRGASAIIGGPLIKDRLFLGVSLRHYEKDGYVKNVLTGDEVDDREHNYGKVNLRLAPTDTLDITLIKSILSYDDGAGSLGNTFQPDREVTSDLEGENTSSNDLTSLKVHGDITPDVAIDSVTTHRRFHGEQVQDNDFTSNPMLERHLFLDNVYTKSSQELRLSGTSGNLSWLMGLYADIFENDIDETWTGVMPMTVLQTIDGDSLGIFGHINYGLTPRLNIIAGLRYDDEKKELDDKAKDLNEKNTYDEVSPKLALNYHVTPDIMGYVTIAKGYRSGGFNPYAVTGYPKTYDEETLYSYDIGFKSRLLQKRLTLNANLYYMDISDMQVTAHISKSNPVHTYTSNAAEATSQGAEIEFTALLGRSFTLFGGLGLNETTFDSFEDALGNYSGNENRFAPKYSFNCGLAYRDARGLFAQVDATGYGDMYLDKTNTTKRDAYELVNVKLGYEAQFFDIYLYGRNVFDTTYDTIGFAGIYNIYSPPAEWGARVTVRF
ncbi:TonB-dependent receptor [Desulfoluna butyratoxydans]|uniref:Tonb-dependent receptor beta-barrel n=1 Tax=Desulfoluna butyratoxydans TaxID=231438 RepID=A0A4U8YU54_9BACT|nr:TonB-dependent receptor [Desulfoluna butyratoxydans]VFQ46929.1 tonb-dependent receptor beta-barrel [Desulfoluna butyratoxydans]